MLPRTAATTGYCNAASLLPGIETPAGVIGEYALALFQLSGIISVGLGYAFFKERNIRKKLFGTVIMIIGAALIILFES